MNSKTLPKQLANARKSRTLVRIERGMIDGEHAWVHGYVADVNDTFVLIQVVGEQITFDGFNVLRLRDVTRLHIPDPHAKFVERALKLRGQRRRAPRGINLASLRSVLRTVNERYPLVVVHRERVSPHTCKIGRVNALNVKTFALKCITPDAVWDDECEQFCYGDVTRVDFAGGYENALALAAGLIKS